MIKMIKSIRENTTLNRVFQLSEFVFKISFLLYGLATYNSFTAHTKVVSVFLMTAVATAGISLIYRLLNYKHFIHNKVFWLSMAFLVSYLITFALNIQYANVNGLKTLVFFGMVFCLLLATDDRKRLDDRKGEMRIVFSVFSVYMFLASLASLAMMAFGYGEIVKRNNVSIISGFVWGRLWGVFIDPNYASVLAAMAIIISLYALWKFKKPLGRVVHILNIVIQMLYISFSDSRTGLVVAIAASLIFSFCYFLTRDFHVKKTLAKNALCVLLAILVGAMGFLSIKVINKSYNAVISSISENAPDEEAEDAMDKFKLGRESDTEQDFSNRRFDLWESAIETVKLKPVFGVLYDNLVDFVQDNLPETYLVNNDHGVFNNYHNIFFNVLVGQGIIGVLLLFALIICAGLKLLKALYSAFKTQHYALCVLMFTLLVSILLSSLFVTDIFYTTSPNMMMFWYLLGIMLAVKTKEGEKIDKTQRDNPRL